MRKCREWISLHLLILSPFHPHFLILSSFHPHFLILFPFPRHFLILFPFPRHFLIIFPFSRSPTARLQQVVQPYTWVEIRKPMLSHFGIMKIGGKSHGDVWLLFVSTFVKLYVLINNKNWTAKKEMLFERGLEIMRCTLRKADLMFWWVLMFSPSEASAHLWKMKCKKSRSAPHPYLHPNHSVPFIGDINFHCSNGILSSFHLLRNA